jgi:Holliday junction resolvase
MPINSKKKGAGFELKIVHRLTDFGIDAHRSQQFCGANGDADVVAPEFPFHLECKAVEKLNIHKAMDQSTADAKSAGKPPCVVHKKNRTPILFTCKLDDLLELITQ